VVRREKSEVSKKMDERQKVTVSIENKGDRRFAGEIRLHNLATIDFDVTVTSASPQE
jgi:hypothetical protein